MGERQRDAITVPRRWAGPVALVWLAVSGTAVGIVTLGFVDGLRDPDALRTPHVQDVFAVLGIPDRLGVAVSLLLPFLVYVGSAALVFWRRPRDVMALVFSASLLALQVLISVVSISVLDGGGLGRTLALVELHLAAVGLLAILFLFPNGRPYPRWATVVGPLLAVAAVASSAGPQMTTLIRPEDLAAGVTAPGPLVAGAAALVGCYAQWRRYHDDADEVQRLQIRWVTLPLGAMFLYLFALIIIPTLVVGVSDRWLGWVMVSAIPFGIAFPVAVAVALLRHRLYDLDLVVSRTLVYGGLAAAITAIYLGVVVGIGSALGTGDRTNVVLAVGVTAVVAVAFQPARAWLTRVANRVVFGQRATPLEVLADFSDQLAAATTTERTLERMAELLAEGTRAALAEVRVATDGDLRTAARHGDATAEGEEHTAEVRDDGELLGALTVTAARGTTLRPQDRRLVENLASQAGLVLRNARLTGELLATIEQLRASRKRIVAAGDEQRRRLERDLHDGAQQQFVAVRIKAQLARRLAEQGDERATTMLDDVLTGLDDGVQALRELAHGIYPPLLEAEGLPTAIASRARRSPVPTHVSGDGLSRYAPEVEAAVYFCVLEALQNVAKYADATAVEVSLRDDGDRLAFEVRDDGAGFAPDAIPGGRGVANMTDRLDALGGELELRSEPGVGTTVRGSVPLAGARRAPTTPAAATPDLRVVDEPTAVGADQPSAPRGST